MLYIYGTVFNNQGTLINSIESLSKINIEKQFLIVDNFSTDGTYELLGKIKEKYNIVIKRIKCSRGSGRQIAMEIGYDKATNEDLFMTFDLDTTYTSRFVTLIEYGVKILNHNEIFLNQLCFKQTNFKVKWKDLNNGEDWERMANFLYSGYRITNVREKYYDLGNNYAGRKREKRYATGINYYRRIIKNQIDLFRGWNISSYKNLKQFMEYADAKSSHFIPLLLILIYIKLFNHVYKYSDEINILYVKHKMEFINAPYTDQ